MKGWLGQLSMVGASRKLGSTYVCSTNTGTFSAEAWESTEAGPQAACRAAASRDRQSTCRAELLQRLTYRAAGRPNHHQIFNTYITLHRSHSKTTLRRVVQLLQSLEAPTLITTMMQRPTGQ